ncbi:MAG: flagellar biosynthesis protein FlhA [Thermoleophilia bacterium]|nr:flagellar biosynthesis protein FlhA [Thermoleophilia bacterium]
MGESSNTATRPGGSGFLGRVLAQSDLLVALGIVVIVVMMIVPIPHVLLDLFITLNIATALTIVLISVYARRALDFSAFPTLLLITTLFRLAINISVTRLILLEGDAGEVVESFGGFVIGGSIVVGLVVFFILMVVQFVVITNGAGRVAEVAARFTLDAMPGKQMAIDADLNAGQITDEQARDRRKEIQQEADFYGSMDGAAKFVKGDAIAAVIITMINLFGGIVVGVFQQGLGFMEAINRFSTLSIGDALAAAIPALLISTATGIIVTRAAGDGNLGGDLAVQFTRYPKAILIVAGVLFALGLLPGLPKIPFIGLAIVLFVVGTMLRRQQEQARLAAEVAALEPPAPDGDAPTIENVKNLLPLDILELEIGYGLISLVDEDQGGDLLKRVSMIRRQVAHDLGMVLAPIRLRDNVQLASHEYAFKLKGSQIVVGSLLPGCWLAMNPGDAEPGLEGTPTTEPAFNLPALWIPTAVKERAEAMGYTVVDPASIIVTHLTETIRQHAADLLTRQDVRGLLDALKERYPAAVDELVPDVLALGEVHRVLQALLTEGVGIRDLASLVETLADKGRLTKDIGLLADYCRQTLARSILRPFLGPGNVLNAITLDGPLEAMLGDAVVQTGDGSYLNLDPGTVNAVLTALKGEYERVSMHGMVPVVLCSAKVRRHLKQVSEPVLPRLAVVSYNEIQRDVDIQMVARVSLDGGAGAMADDAGMVSA